jgi:uncharacterized protein
VPDGATAVGRPLTVRRTPRQPQLVGHLYYYDSILLYKYTCRPESTRAVTIVNRTDELHELRKLLEAGAPRLALLYGRRRVGKTFLLTHAWPAARTFYFTASDTTSPQNRVTLLEELARWSGERIDPEEYPTWRTVFRLLLTLRAPEPVAVVIDEFQYLATSAKKLGGIASELNAVWEERRSARPLVLALAGSAVRPLEALAEGGAPLHGRFNWQHRLEPLDYWHAAQLAGFRHPRDRAIAYGIFGGIPRYLSSLDPARSLGENVADVMLNPRGEVRLQVETALLQEQALRDTTTYRAILRAIAGGHTLLNDIAQQAGVSLDTPFRDKIQRLVDLGYIVARRNVGARATVPFRYHVADPAQRFHAAFVARFETELARNTPRRVWDTLVVPQLDTYMGLAFEGIVQEAYGRLAAPWGLPMIHEWGRWEGLDAERRPVEVEIACGTSDGGAVSGQVKWNRSPIPASVHHAHLQMLNRLAAAGVAWAHRALEPTSPILYVAAGGFTVDFKQVARACNHPVVLWELDDLYATPRRRPRRAPMPTASGARRRRRR